MTEEDDYDVGSVADENLMDLDDKMLAQAYSAYISSRDVDHSDHYGDALSYIEGDRDIPPLGWQDAMEMLGDLVEEEV